MHPKSRDRSGNDKLLAKIAKQQGLPKPGQAGSRFRRSKYGARLAKIRAKQLDSDD